MNFRYVVWKNTYIFKKKVRNIQEKVLIRMCMKPEIYKINYNLIRLILSMCILHAIVWYTLI